jgi:hypothetical protein
MCRYIRKAGVVHRALVQQWPQLAASGDQHTSPGEMASSLGRTARPDLGMDPWPVDGATRSKPVATRRVGSRLARGKTHGVDRCPRETALPVRFAHPNPRMVRRAREWRKPRCVSPRARPSAWVASDRSSKQVAGHGSLIWAIHAITIDEMALTSPIPPLNTTSGGTVVRKTSAQAALDKLSCMQLLVAELGQFAHQCMHLCDPDSCDSYTLHIRG